MADELRPRVPKLWPGETAVCIGGGPSLTAADVDACRDRGVRVIAVNDAYRLAPWADVVYACDDKWWGWHHKHVAPLPALKYSIAAIRGKWPGVVVLKCGRKHGLELAPTHLATGGNSGYQAINLCVHFGIRRVLLLGYDMGLDAKKRSHWFGEHPSGRQSSYASFQAAFMTIGAPLQAIGVDVINCSRHTALKCFPRMPIDEALAQLGSNVVEAAS